MKRESVSPSSLWKTEAFGFSHGILVEGRKMLFISGQAGINKDGEVMKESFEVQCKQAFESIRAVLAEVGANFHNVIKINGYLTDMGKLATFGKIASEFFKGELPAQTLIEVKGLALPGMQVEIEAVAIL